MYFMYLNHVFKFFHYLCVLLIRKEWKMAEHSSAKLTLITASFCIKIKTQLLVSLALRLIHFSSLSAVFFCWRYSPKTWPNNHRCLWSHLTIILDTKSRALTGTGCQIKPFNDKFSPKVSWEISFGLHCGKKALNLTLNLNRLFSCRPWKFGCICLPHWFHTGREQPKVKLRFRSSTTMDLIKETAFDSSFIPRCRKQIILNLISEFL